MNIHEYQAKELFVKFGVPTPKGRVADTAEQAQGAAAEIGSNIVVKAQVHAGGRGKGTFKNGFKGGVHVVQSAAEAADIAGMVISPRSADVFSPKAIRASMGAVFRMPVWEGAEFSQLTVWSEQNGLMVTASDVSADSSYTDIDWKIPRSLVIGSEAHGLEADELASVADKILIPMANGVESLNLAVATGIMLFEAKRQND